MCDTNQRLAEALYWVRGQITLMGVIVHEVSSVKSFNFVFKEQNILFFNDIISFISSYMVQRHFSGAKYTQENKKIEKFKNCKIFSDFFWILNRM